MKQLLIAVMALLCFLSSAYAAGTEDNGQKTVSFKIGKADIAQIDLDSHALTILLNSATTKRLAAITASHVGDMMTLYYQDLRVQRAQINGRVNNGLIYVTKPSEALKRKVAPLLAKS